MKVVHVCPMTPHRCGMWETVRELVAEERRQGVDAWAFDPRPPGGSGPDARPPDWSEDRGVCLLPFHMCLSADVLVSHSGLDGRFDSCSAPRVHVAHGRPNSSYRIERSGQTPILTTYADMVKDPRWRAIVTLWPAYADYWRLLFPRVEVVPAWVDLAHWTPAQATGRLPEDYWGADGGRPNVMVADIWRMDKDPFHVLHGFARFAEGCPAARMHLFGVEAPEKGIKPLLDGLRRRGVLGRVSGITPDLRPAYRAADVFATPHTMATRTVREALACGAQVVGGLGNPHTPYRADPEDLGVYADEIGRAWAALRADRPGRREANRAQAERDFDLPRSVRAFLGLLSDVRSEGGITGGAARNDAPGGHGCVSRGLRAFSKDTIDRLAAG